MRLLIAVVLAAMFVVSGVLAEGTEPSQHSVVYIW